MVRQLEIKIWCDPCNSQDIQAEAEELPPVALGHSKPRVVAMCKEHRENLYEPFVAVLTEHGALADQLTGGTTSRRHRTISSPSNAKDSSTGLMIQCPIEDCAKPLKNVSSVAAHVRRVHDTNLYELLGPEGTLIDVEGNVVDTPKFRERRRR